MATTKATLLGHRSATSFSDLTLSGDLTVNGTTTTLDTAVQNVDKLEIGASSTDYGAKINQASTGNILQLQDGGTDVMVVADGGNVGIGVSPSSLVHASADDPVLTIADTANNSADGDVQSKIKLAGRYHSGTADPLANTYSQAEITLIKDSGDGTGGSSLTFKTSDTGGGGLSEKMRIDKAGNVGIGTTSFTSTASGRKILEINSDAGTAGALLNFSAGGTRQAYLFHDTNGMYIFNEQNNDMRFATNNTESMRIISGGQIRIKCANMNANPSSSNSGVFIGDTNTASLFFGGGTGVESQLLFGNTNGVVGSIQTSGSSTAFNTSSDYRLKENVNPLTGAIERLNQLKPSRFNFIADSDTTMDGFLAHEVSDHVPEAVSGEKDQVDEDGEIKPQGIDQSKLVPLIVASIQELSAKVTALENA